MYFEDNEERFINPDLFHVVHNEQLFEYSSNLEITPFGLRSVPTHTEDGIPIRKLYVSNLPPKTTRTELFGVFAQYGFIKSCWLQLGDKAYNKTSTAAYAFVTFSNPEDAHKALLAPEHDMVLRGRSLHVSPADSWHQPAEEADGRVRWKRRGKPRAHRAAAASPDGVPATSSNSEESRSEIINQAEEPELEPAERTYTILDVLNHDCMMHVLSFVPIRDLIASERVSRSWQNMVQEYLSSIRTFKTSWWQHSPVTLTTAVLRRVLQRLGPALLRLHIDHHWSALNDRTAHAVGKFAPGLEELKVVGMHTKNWNPVIYGCKSLKSISFVSCNKLTDTSLVQLVKEESRLESLTVANNTHVTGLFLTGAKPPRLTSLAFFNCYGLQATVLSAAVASLPQITCLKLDVCLGTMWKFIPSILTKLPKLEELSLSEYTSVDICLIPLNDINEAFCEALATLTELKTLNLSRNIYISNVVMKQISLSCFKLESLNISCCNARLGVPFDGVDDEGIQWVCGRCTALRRVDVSYLAALSDAGLRALAALPALEELVARGNAALSAAPLAALLAACHQLREVDVCGCERVDAEVVWAAERALQARPRALALRLAATAVLPPESGEAWPAPRLLTVDVADDRSNPHLRPDFVDRIFDTGSDDSMDDLYDHDDFDDFLAGDDDLFLDDEEEFDGIFQFNIHGPDIILL